MAYTALTVQSPSDVGAALTFAAAVLTDGNKFANDGKTFVQVNNASGGDITVTFPTGATFEGQAVADTGRTVTAGTIKTFGPFKQALYDQPSGGDKGNVLITFSAVTTVTVAAFH